MEMFRTAFLNFTIPFDDRCELACEFNELFDGALSAASSTRVSSVRCTGRMVPSASHFFGGDPVVPVVERDTARPELGGVLGGLGAQLLALGGVLGDVDPGQDGLAVAIFVLYRSSVRRATQPATMPKGDEIS